MSLLYQCAAKEVISGRTFLKEGFSQNPSPRTLKIAASAFSQREKATCGALKNSFIVVRETCSYKNILHLYSSFDRIWVLTAYIAVGDTMALDLPMLRQVAEELNAFLAGGFVNKVHQPLPREIVLRVRAGGGEKKLMLSADPQQGRLHVTSLKIPNPPRPPRFCAYLRAHFQGARITAITCSETDRVVRIAAHRGPSGGGTELSLYLELLGRDSNIILVGADGVILDSLYHLSAKESATRVVTPGRVYADPPRNPNSREPRVSSGAGRPGITTSAKGKPILTLCASDDDEVCPSANDAVEALYSGRLQHTLTEVQRKHTAAPVISRIKALDRRMLKIQADIARLEEYTRMQEEGELLKANLHRLNKGMRRAEVTDWEGRPRIIQLDPALDPLGNMNRIFKKAAKGKRGRSVTSERLALTRQEKAGLEDYLYYIETAGPEDLEAMAAPAPQPRGPRPTKATPDSHAGHGYLTVTLSSGAVAYVGKSAKGNDHLLKQKADRNCLWFHVKDYPGAHVILAGRSSFTEDDIGGAAKLAAEHSKAGAAGKVEVMMAAGKDVGKLKGGAPGQVQIRSYATRLVNLDG